MKKNENYYLKKAIALADRDWQKLDNIVAVYLPTEERLGRKPNVADHLKALKLSQSPRFNLEKIMTEMYHIEKAISDLKTTIFFKDKKNFR